MNQDLIIYTVTVITAMALIAFIFFYLIPYHEYRNSIKQKAKEDREAKREADKLLGEYPTYSRYCTNEMFQATEISYSLPVTQDL